MESLDICMIAFTNCIVFLLYFFTSDSLLFLWISLKNTFHFFKFIILPIKRAEHIISLLFVIRLIRWWVWQYINFQNARGYNLLTQNWSANFNRLIRLATPITWAIHLLSWLTFIFFLTDLFTFDFMF